MILNVNEQELYYLLNSIDYNLRSRNDHEIGIMIGNILQIKLKELLNEIS